MHDTPHLADAPTDVPDVHGVEQPSASRAELPVPTVPVAVDAAKAEQWILAEPDPALQAVRRELVDGIHTVGFAAFHEQLQHVAEAFVDTMQHDEQPYLLLYDGKPHASKRWVAELVRDELAQYPPAASSYLSKLEIPLGMPTITAALDRGITNFAVFDDAIYSGEQIMNVVVRPIFELARTADFQARYPNRQLTITLAAPYISNRFLTQAATRQLQEAGFLRLVGGYEVMPTVDTTLSAAAHETIDGYGGRITADPQADVFYMPPTYVFDHRVPDSHSFPEELQPVLVAFPAKPYALPDQPYYGQEDAAFAAYWQPLVQRKLAADRLQQEQQVV